MIFYLWWLFLCLCLQVFRSYEQEIWDEHDGRAELLSWAVNQADPWWDLCASMQVYKWRLEEVLHGRGQASFDTHVHHDGAWSRWGRQARGPKGLQEHDWLSPILDLDEARYTLCSVFVRSFLSRPTHFTPEFGLWYSSSSVLSLCGYSDDDFAGCRSERKSTSRTCQFLGTSVVSWSSCKQSRVAQCHTRF